MSVNWKCECVFIKLVPWQKLLSRQSESHFQSESKNRDEKGRVSLKKSYYNVAKRENFYFDSLIGDMFSPRQLS